MTKKELTAKLEKLSIDMQEIALEMSRHPYPASYHAVELDGAAMMVLAWIDGIKKEEK